MLEPSKPPTGLSGQPVPKEAKIDVFWVPPEPKSLNGNLTSYTVYWAVAEEMTERDGLGRPLFNDRPPTMSAEVKDPGAVKFRISGSLRYFTEYFIWLRANNIIGAGPLSEPISVKTSEGSKFITKTPIHHPRNPATHSKKSVVLYIFVFPFLFCRQVIVALQCILISAATSFF